MCAGVTLEHLAGGSACARARVTRTWTSASIRNDIAVECPPEALGILAWQKRIEESDLPTDLTLVDAADLDLRILPPTGPAPEGPEPVRKPPSEAVIIGQRQVPRISVGRATGRCSSSRRSVTCASRPRPRRRPLRRAARRGRPGPSRRAVAERISAASSGAPSASPHAYLLTRRLERAAALLRSRGGSLGRVGRASRSGCGASARSRRASPGPTGRRRRRTARRSRRHRDTPGSRPASSEHTPARNTARFEKTPERHRRQHRLDDPRPKEVMMIKISFAGVWVHDSGRGARLLYRQARMGAARRRHAAGVRQLPVAHGGAARPTRGVTAPERNPRAAGDRRDDRRADPGVMA